MVYKVFKQVERISKNFPLVHIETSKYDTMSTTSDTCSSLSKAFKRFSSHSCCLEMGLTTSITRCLKHITTVISMGLRIEGGANETGNLNRDKNDKNSTNSKNLFHCIIQIFG